VIALDHAIRTISYHVFWFIADRLQWAARLSMLETGIEMMRAYGRGEAVVRCAMLREDGPMARMDEVRDFAEQERLPIVDIAHWVENR
jgi:3,4-dihydroxy-2-butanone 4-phosphate synthase